MQACYFCSTGSTTATFVQLVQQLPLQDQGLPHKLWIKAHGVLLVVHMILHTLLHKAAPAICDEPLLMPMAMGTKVMPYREIIYAWYRDGIMVAGVLCLIVLYALCV